MSDQLRDVMTRIAERAEPAASDPTLWARAKRARRHGELITASAVGATVFALVLSVGVLLQPTRDAADPTEGPAERPGIPSIVRGVFSDGDLRLEGDLAVGAASVAIANPTGAFVITAEDGIYHRLDLPGFDAAVYDDPEVRRTGMVGLSLSPDGTRLAYGWHDPLPRGDTDDAGFVPSGVRILDLLTGDVEDVPEDRSPPAEFALAVADPGVYPWARVAYGLRWSTNGRFLTYQLVWASASYQGQATAAWGRRLVEAYDHRGFATGVSVYDVVDDRRFDVRGNRYDGPDFWLGHIWAMEGWPQAVADDGTVAAVSVNNDVDVAPLGARSATRGRLPGGAGNDDHTVGLVTGQDRVLIETRSPSSHLLAIDLRTGTTERLELPLTSVHVDLVGLINPNHVLALVRQGTEQNLVVFNISDAEVESNLAAPFDDEGSDSTFSFATDFATVHRPTYDFDAAAASASADDDAEAAAPPVDDGPLGAEDGGPGLAWLGLGLAGGLVAASAAVLVLRRRIRPA